MGIKRVPEPFQVWMGTTGALLDLDWVLVKLTDKG